MYTRLSADQSAALLALKIRAEHPFLFLRYGDGALECMSGQRGETRDGEVYSAELGRALDSAWRMAVGAPTVYVGDWQSASFDARSEPSRYREEYAELIGARRPNWLHFEALLLMRESPALADFYCAARSDRRRKIFLGPRAAAGAAKLLGAVFFEVPMQNLFAHVGEIEERLGRTEFDVLYWGAGMASSIPVVQDWVTHPERTYVNLGSALDPLFRGITRRQQIRPERARMLLRGLL